MVWDPLPTVGNETRTGMQSPPPHSTRGGCRTRCAHTGLVKFPVLSNPPGVPGHLVIPLLQRPPWPPDFTASYPLARAAEGSTRSDSCLTVSLGVLSRTWGRDGVGRGVLRQRRRVDGGNGLQRRRSQDPRKTLGCGSRLRSGRLSTVSPLLSPAP